MNLTGKLTGTELLAVLRITEEVGGPEHIESIVVNERQVDDLPQVLADAQRLWAEASGHEAEAPPASMQTPAAPTPADQAPGLRRRLRDGADRLIGRAVQRAERPEGGAVSWVLRKVVTPMAADGTQVLRAATAQVRLRDGTAFSVTAQVLDVAATRGLIKADIAMTSPSVAVIPVPGVGLAYGVAAPVVAAVAAHGKARAAREHGEPEIADGYGRLGARQRAMVVNSLLPVWGPAIALFAAANAGRRLAALRHLTSVDQVVALESREPLPVG